MKKGGRREHHSDTKSVVYMMFTPTVILGLSYRIDVFETEKVRPLFDTVKSVASPGPESSTSEWPAARAHYPKMYNEKRAARTL
ncbi:hypothetical protein EVAR_57847_1 [Eumeta japonica]|uniref:Uncharacterized protein n=1 Tax=Eumeta variegata TaxID=151549 RepID=A0A4C1YWD8_EUMVA|nr:hypothetical protein EVAR_57847_1 [Eumeta japonica]